VRAQYPEMNQIYWRETAGVEKSARWNRFLNRLDAVSGGHEKILLPLAALLTRFENLGYPVKDLPRRTRRTRRNRRNKDKEWGCFALRR
jgi:hypothetical protein